MKQKIMKLATTVIACAAFVALLLINGSALVSSDAKGGTLLTSAYADVEAPSTNGTTCGSDECTLALTIAGTGYTATGHYYHCKTTPGTGNCNSSSCTVACDAKIVIF